MRGFAPLFFPVILLAPAACGPDYSPNTYASSAVQQANKVDRGVVVGVRKVAVSAPGTAGAVTGAAAGGIAGSQAPGGNVTSAFGALGGALVGGLVGTAAEHTVSDTDAYEYVVRKVSADKDNGELLSVTQKDQVPLAIGQKVLVIAGSQARIVPDYTVQLDMPSAPEAKKPDADKSSEQASKSAPPPASSPTPEPRTATATAEQKPAAPSAPEPPQPTATAGQKLDANPPLKPAEQPKDAGPP